MSTYNSKCWQSCHAYSSIDCVTKWQSVLMHSMTRGMLVRTAPKPSSRWSRFWLVEHFRHNTWKESAKWLYMFSSYWKKGKHVFFVIFGKKSNLKNQKRREGLVACCLVTFWLLHSCVHWPSSLVLNPKRYRWKEIKKMAGSLIVRKTITMVE